MADRVHVAPGVSQPELARLGQIGALDGLRAIAALMVLTTHVAFHTGLVTDPGLGPIVSRLDLGVCIFFLLSGFLLYRPWARSAMSGNPRPRKRAYARKRIARIYPAYFVLVVVVLGLYPPVAPATLEQWLSYLTLTHIYVSGMEISQLNQTWSLATEVAFYALLPVLGWVLGRRNRGDPDRSVRWQLVGLLGMAVAAFGFQMVRSWTTLLPDWLSSFWLPGFLDWFAIGMALAVVQVRLSLPAAGRPPSSFLRLRDLAHDANTALVVAGLCFAIVATPLAGKYYFNGGFGPDTAGPWAILTKHYLYAACGAFLLLPLVLGSADHWYARALSSPVMARLGTISYGIFLWHLLLISVIADALGLGVFQGGFWLLWPMTILATVVVSTVSWQVLEKPVLDWAHGKRRWPRRPAHRGRARVR